MGKLTGRKFRKIVLMYGCDYFVLKQIKAALKTAVIPDDEIVLEKCVLKLVDHSKRLFFRERRTRYFISDFYVTYNLSVKTSLFNPYLEIDFNSADEITGVDYEKRMETLPEEEILIEAKRIINPDFRLRIVE